MAANWNRRFDEPIKLPGGGKLFTLKHAIAWLAKEIPQSEHRMKEVQTAAHCVTAAAQTAAVRPDRHDAGHQPALFDPVPRRPPQINLISAPIPS
jgi:hypothetical protein